MEAKAIRGIFKRVDRYDLLSLGLLAVVLAIALSYWSRFPVHMDTYYHMGVTSGYSTAGGVSLRAFWEYAPVGRPQLYPPLLHVIMYTLTGLGMSMLTAGRLVAFAAFPLIVLTNWYGMRRIFSSRTAFYTTVMLCSCYLLFWHSAVESAASLVLILTPLIFVAVERDRKIAGALLLALALYSHLTLGHLVAFGLLIYGIHRRKNFKEILWILAGAYLLWLPWGLQILLNRGSLSFSNPTGGGYTLHILVWVVALAGFVYCYFKKGKYYLLPSFLLGFIPIVFFYPDRFWNAHVFLPLAMLGGVALSGLQGFLGERAERVVNSRTASAALMTAVMAVPVALLLFVDPVYSGGGGMRGGARPMMAGLRNLRADGGYWPGAGAEGGRPLPPVQGRPGGQNGLPSSPPPGAGGFKPPLGPPPGAGPQLGGAGAIGGLPGPGGPGGMGGPMGGPGGGAPGQSSGLSMSDTLLESLISGTGGRGQQSLTQQSVIGSDELELAGLIEENSRSDQIIGVTDGPLGNLVTGLTGRPSTGGMFHEVKADGNAVGEDYAQNAALVVISSGRAGKPMAPRVYSGNKGNLPMGGPGMKRAASIDTSKYELIGTVGRYTVYRNPSSATTVIDHGTVIPWYAVYTILALILAAVLIDWFRPSGWPGRKRATSTETPPDDCSGGPGASGGGDRRVLAIVPCFNEAANVGSVVAEIRRAVPYADVLVVDDGSTDGSATIAHRAGAIVIAHPGNSGAGAAVRSGMEYALAHRYAFEVQVDGDGQHDPAFIPNLLVPIRSGLADVSIGSRFMGTDGYRPPFLRRLGIMLLSATVSSVTGRRIIDATSGFRAMNRLALSRLVREYPDYYGEAESFVIMDRKSVTWTEVPVSMRARAGGVSSIGGFGSLAFMFKVMSGILHEASVSRQTVPRAGSSLQLGGALEAARNR